MNCSPIPLLFAYCAVCSSEVALGAKPPAPQDLTADGVVGTTTDIRLTWTDSSSNEANFEIQRRFFYDDYATLATLPANTTTFVDHQPGTWVYRVRASNADGSSAFSNEAGAVPNTLPFTCNPEPVFLCLHGGRFRAEVLARTPTLDPEGQAVPLPSAPDSGLFYFFSPANIEMLIKTLDGCGLNNRYWVFYAATTNVEFIVTVSDTQNGRVHSYFNPLNRPAPPVQDTSAFATCP